MFTVRYSEFGFKYIRQILIKCKKCYTGWTLIYREYQGGHNFEILYTFIAIFYPKGYSEKMKQKTLCTMFLYRQIIKNSSFLLHRLHLICMFEIASYLHT